MEKKMELLNIYLKIHQKRDLSWEDLEYLARFDPECFEKTCKNVVYNIPQAKPVILPKEEKTEPELAFDETEKDNEEKVSWVKQMLEKMKHMEVKQVPVSELDIGRVKTLLGDLYMELLFPHNDKDSFFSATGEEKGSIFDKKA